MISGAECLSLPSLPCPGCVRAFQVTQETNACTDGAIGNLLKRHRMLRRPVAAVDAITQVIVSFN